jgi:hypothetical protein
MEWISCKDRMPTEDGRYLVTETYLVGKYRGMNVLSWANDLSKINKYCFEDKAGFYYSDPEWGYCEANNVLAWCKVEPYGGE